ncbi:hypothetical protein STAQ_10010 [Allostella sp. ATCC 35155]|nr:hypothetical protein STAQ_10010 [Stella sp. ATCC 35155]
MRWLSLAAALAAALLPLRAAEQRTVVELSPSGIAAGQRIVVRGHNPGPGVALLVVRADDDASHDYSSRMNEERSLPPGPFELAFDAGALRAASGRSLRRDRIHRVIVFVADGPKLDLREVAIVSGFRLPAGALGFDLGPKDLPPSPGFERISPEDPRIEGRHRRAVRRVGGQPFLEDGILGVERLVLAPGAGAWRVSLWTEEPGEWEFLPHPLERRIRANGVTLLERRETVTEWVERRYLAGRAREAIADGDAWDLLGQPRGGLLSAVVPAIDGRIAIELAGDGPSSGYVGAILLEPASGEAGRNAVEAEREAQFRRDWRWNAASTLISGSRLSLRPATPYSPAGTGDPATVMATAAPGTGATFEVVAVAAQDDAQPDFALTAPSNGTTALPSELRFGHWRFRRSDPAAHLLVLDDDHLRGDADRIGLRAGIPRRLSIRVSVPASATPGRYAGRLRVGAGGAWEEVALVLRVPAVELPQPDRPVGIYLEHPPHLAWLPDAPARQRRALDCDLATLRRLGLSGLAPPLPTPRDAEAQAETAAILQRAHAAGFLEPVLAYAPLKRMSDMPPAQAAARIAEADRRTVATGLRPPAWSAFDEPGNSAHGVALDALVAAIRAASPTTRIAGHFNDPRDRPRLAAVDIAFLNRGFGIDAAAIAAVRAAGAQPWLYNLEQPRLAAGFYLWRSGAGGYLEWHGRMPTADPFDPTDGREGDVQLLWPTAEICPTVPDIDARLLCIAEGITDLRWALWLERRARTDTEAEVLLRKLRAEIPARWDDARPLADATARAWRTRIVALAP